MGWFILKYIFSTIFTFITFIRQTDLEEDLEILILCQQLSILQHKLITLTRSNIIEIIYLLK